MIQKRGSILASILAMLIMSAIILGVAFFFRGVLHVIREYDNDAKKEQFKKDATLIPISKCEVEDKE